VETVEEFRGRTGSREETVETSSLFAYLPHFLKINELKKKRVFFPWKRSIFLTCWFTESYTQIDVIFDTTVETVEEIRHFW